MWDVLKWQNGTLSVAWWALVAFALLVIIAAGSHAKSKSASGDRAARLRRRRSTFVR